MVTGPVISYQNVHASVGGRRLFRGITLDLYENEVFVLFGPSNCGKSLFARLALGTLKPESGTVCLEGRDLSLYEHYELPHVRRKIGAVLMNSALISNLTAGENVALPLRYHTSLGEGAIQDRVDRILDFFAALPHKNHRPVELDVVARRKVAVARALMLRPQIVFLDEPTVNLEFIAANRLQEGLFSFLKSDLWHDAEIFETTGFERKETTVFIATNDPSRYLLFGTRFSMLYEGQLVFKGTTEELMDTANRHVHQFVTGRADGPVREY